MCRYIWLSPDCVFLCRLQHLVAHTVSYHQPVNTKMITHTCSQCGAIFSRLHSLHLHEATHRGCYPYTCDICGKGCLYKSNFNRHMASHGTHDFKCWFCPQQYIYATSLKKHVQYCHKDADGNVPKMPKRGYNI